MDCTMILGIFTSLLLAITTSQNIYPGYVPNPDQIYFIDDRPRLPLPLSVEPQSVTQQPTIQQTVQPKKISQGVDDGADVPSRNTNMMRSKEVLRLDDTAKALTSFSIDLMKEVSQQAQGNTVVSPYSIATVLSLLQQGATGQTLEQLTQTLQMGPEMSAASYKTRSANIQKRQSRNILRTANNIFLANGFTLSPAFRATALRDFRTDVTPTNFAAAAQTAQDINKWVAASTDNKIQNLISPDTLSENTQMVLVNAIYFKGLWEVPFRKQATTTEDFHLSNRAVKKAQFMQTRRYFRTGADPYTGSKVILLPFEREEYSLMVILPHSLVSVNNILSMLSVSQLQEYLNFPYLETELHMPKFSLKADTELRSVLQQMGVTKIFGSSELSNIGTFENMSPQVSEAVHSAAFTIDEEGGSASAATAFSVVALSNDSPSVIFKANRPFLAILWDAKAKIPLFVAKIEDPTLLS